MHTEDVVPPLDLGFTALRVTRVAPALRHHVGSYVTSQYLTINA